MFWQNDKFIAFLEAENRRKDARIAELEAWIKELVEAKIFDREPDRFFEQKKFDEGGEVLGQDAYTSAEREAQKKIDEDIASKTDANLIVQRT